MLNAKQHQREADIVAQAGRLGAVTIATNMAGRGTDIILGGNAETMAWAQLQNTYDTRLDVPKDEWDTLINSISERENMKTEGNKVREMGGLQIVGTERHESRRIDLQLRGRCGRQGDPGSSRFYLSLEDDLMRIFAGEWVKNILTRLGMQDGEAIESKMVTRRVEAAQKKVEERNFEIRKNLLEYDEVMKLPVPRISCRFFLPDPWGFYLFKEYISWEKCWMLYRLLCNSTLGNLGFETLNSNSCNLKS